MKSSLVAIPSLLQIIKKKKKSHFFPIGYLYKKYSPNMSSSIQNICIQALIKCRPFTVFMDFFSTSMQKVWSTLMTTSCLCKEGLLFVSSRADHSIWGVFYTVPLSENHMLLGVQVQQFKWLWLIWYRLLWRKYFSQLNVLLILT